MRNKLRMLVAMSMRLQLLTLASTFVAHSKWAAPTVSTRVFGGGAVLARIEAGGDVTTGNYERAVMWFSTNWPADVAWPADVPRPFAQLSSTVSSPEEVA
jgi:hypothetical protein